MTRCAAALLVTTALAVVGAAPAFAHAGLERTLPASGSVVPQAPSVVELTFSEPVDVALGRIVVMGPDGRPAATGPAASDGAGTARVPLREGLPRGTYLVSYRVLSDDGHPVAGGFTFSVIAPSPLADVVPVAGDAPVDGWVRAAMTASHVAGDVGLVLLAAAVLLATALRRAGLDVAPARSPAVLGGTTLAAGTLLAILVAVPYSSGSGLTGITVDALVEQARTPVVQAYLARLVLLTVAAPLLRDLTGGRRLRRAARVEAVLLALGLFATWPLTGHDASGPAWPQTTAAGTAHVAGTAVWLGGLTALARCLRPLRADRIRALLARWPRQAAVAAVVVVLTGVVQALPQTGSARALTDTTYGRLLLAKVALTLAVLAVGGAAHRLIARRSGGERAPGLRRVVGSELAAASVVVGLAAVLVQATPGRIAASDPAAAGELLVPPSPGQPVYGIERTNGLTLQVDVAPLQVGRNTMLITLIDRAGQPVTPQSWTVDVSMPREGIHDVSVPVDATMGAGSAVALPQLSSAGDWTFTVTARATLMDTVVMRRSIRVY